MSRTFEPGGTFGPYTIEEVIARGARRVLLKARHRQRNRLVALQILRDASPRESRRFQEEARLLAKLEHPSLPELIEVGAWEQRPCVATAYLEGEVLATRVAKRGIPPLDWTLRVVTSLAEALACCHSIGLTHHDLTPADVVIEAGERPVLVGLALLAGDEQRIGAGSHPGFLAPERFSADASLGAATDVYALGACLHFLLTGEPPFGRGSRAKVIEDVLSADPPDLRQLQPDLPPALAQLCWTALAKAPEERPPSAEAFARVLSEVS